MAIGEDFETVLAAAQEGAEWAWEVLFREMAAPVAGYLAIRGASSADDLVGEVFVQLARNLKTFRGGETSFRSWVFMIAHNRLIDDRRARSRKPTEPLSDDVDQIASPVDVEEEALNRVMETRLRDLLEILTPDQRDVVALRIIGGLTLEETAKAMHKRVKAVSALQRRGIAALRRRISAQGVDHPGNPSVTPVR